MKNNNSLPFLPSELQFRIIYQAVLLEILDVGKIRENKKNLLFSLLYNTHCFGCGRYNLVSLRGYVGQYCSKHCWKYFHDDKDSGYDTERAHNLDYIYEKYIYILKDIDKVSTFSNAISKRHRPYHDSTSPSGKVWPMVRKPCYNELICGIGY